MSIEESILALLVPFALVLTRLSGLFLLVPVFTARGAPRRFRATLAMVLALAMTPMAMSGDGGGGGGMKAVPEWSVFDLPLAIVLELAIGAVIGMVAMIPIAAMDMAGTIMGHQMGFGLARVYNPDLNAESDSLGQLLMLVATAVYLSMGGLEACFVSIANSFATIPPGGLSGGTTLLEVFLGTIASGTELAIRVSAPVVAIIALLLLVSAVLMKTIPQLNVMSVGFTVKIVAALAALATAMPAVHEALRDHMEGTIRDTLALTWREPTDADALSRLEIPDAVSDGGMR